MNVYLFGFSKKQNSTKRPTLSDGVQFSMQLKAETSVLSPVLIVNKVNAQGQPQQPTVYNYAYIPSFMRYYFISDWQYINGAWVCYCSVDVLATYKLDIGSMSEYVLRSSHSYNGEIVDGNYPATTDISVNATMLTSLYTSVLAGGYYILGVVSNDSNQAMGAITYYQMTPAQLALLKSYMMSASFLSEQGLTAQTVTDVLPTELLKTLYNPFQYIASCEWFPFPASEIPSQLKTSDTHMQFGWWRPTTSVTGSRINANGYVKLYSNRYSILGHPQRYNRGVFLDHAPYTDRMLYFIPFGSIPINDDSIIGGDFIRVEVSVDMVLGDGIISVYHDRPTGNDNYTNMGLIFRDSAKISIPIQLAQTTVDLEGTGNFAVSMGATNFLTGAVQGKSFIGSLKSIGDGVIDAVSNPVGQLETNGNNGSLAVYSQQSYFVQKFKNVVSDDNADFGRPLYQKVMLSTIPGYIKCSDGHFPGNCYDAERTAVNNFLVEGFFYE